MITIRIASLILLVLACLVSTAVGADKVATFSSLPEGDELEMNFATTGCFHFAEYDLKFRRTPKPTVSVVQIGYTWSDELKKMTATNRTTLGELTLSKADLKGLDNLLEFYRSPRRGGCTTHERFSISQRHDGTLTATEHFVDLSCSYERKNLLRITELVLRFEKPK